MNKGRMSAGICLTLCCLCQVVLGQLRLPRLVSDSMVLQREKPVRVWGWAGAGERVRVSVNGQVAEGVTGADGKWTVMLKPMTAGGPYDMTIDGIGSDAGAGGQHMEVKGVLVGDVWVCSGQSNMELPMERVKEKYANVIASAQNPMIRQFGVATRWEFGGPKDDLGSGRWVSATPAEVLNFTAAGYFFARDLWATYHVPIGLIKASVGGSPAEAWLSAEALKEYPVYAAVAARYAKAGYVDSIRRAEDAMNAAWYERLWRRDSGMRGGTVQGTGGNAIRNWYDTAYDAGGWQEMNVPGYWADQGLRDVNGVVWYRKEVDVPGEMLGKPVKLWLGRIVDRDSVYVNGIFSGTIGYQYPPRRYELRPGLLHAGKNVIVVRVINSAGKGGFVPDKPYYLEQGGKRITLAGKWKYRVGARMEPLASTTFFQYQPGALYNGVLAPLLNSVVKGVAWYQGEANAGRAAEYQGLFTTMIADWRKGWGDSALPFLYVQLANFMETRPEPSESGWAVLRDAQRRTLSVAHTGMAVAIDIGEWNDIHPLDKEDVGKRLALAARAVAYGEKGLEYSGPLFAGMRREGGRIRLHFLHTGSGLEIKGGGALRQFAIAGADGKYVWAKAEIAGEDVLVWSEAVKVPVAVRYAWADNPEGANLYNREGLPASPFTTGPN